MSATTVTADPAGTYSWSSRKIAARPGVVAEHERALGNDRNGRERRDGGAVGRARRGCQLDRAVVLGDDDELVAGLVDGVRRRVEQHRTRLDHAHHGGVGEGEPASSK